MAANDEFPRGTSAASAAGVNSTAQIIIPANSLVAHVIERIFVKWVNGVAATSAVNISLSTPSLGTIDGTGMFLEATINAIDTYERDVNIEAPPGDSVTLSIANNAGTDAYIGMAWHDI